MLHSYRSLVDAQRAAVRSIAFVLSVVVYWREIEDKAKLQQLQKKTR
jgi:hypothetical protein